MAGSGSGEEPRAPAPAPQPKPHPGIRIVRSLGLERPFRRHVLPRIRSLADEAKSLPEERQLHGEAKRIGRTAALEKRPVLVGPWLSEVGFEVLYWVPFLHWLTDQSGLDSSRLVAVSRGGSHSWYGGLCDSYREIFASMSVDEFRDLTESRWEAVGGQKQMELTKWDRLVLDKGAGDLSWNRHSVLHPSLMYRMFRPYWRGKAGIDHVLEHVRFKRFETPDPGPWAERLPDDFVAVKFYFRPSFPDTPENRRRVTNVVRSLAEEIPVVVLSTGHSFDDHADVDPGVEDNIILLRDVPPEENLHVQSVALSRARGFVGTYGGFSYLSPFYGLPSVGLYSDYSHFLPSHLEVAQRAAVATGGSLTVLGPEQMDIASSLGVLGVPAGSAGPVGRPA